MRQFLLATAATVTLAACSQGGGNDRKSDKPINKRTKSEELVRYSLEDQQCNPRPDLVGLNPFQGGNELALADVGLNFLNYNAGFLSGSVIDKVLAKESFEADVVCDYDSGFVQCQKKADQQYLNFDLTGGSELKICDHLENLPRRSYEAAAVSALYHVEKAAAFYDDLPASHPLPKINLHVLPEIKFTFDVNDPNDKMSGRYIQYESDNAWYVSGIQQEDLHSSP